MNQENEDLSTMIINSCRGTKVHFSPSGRIHFRRCKESFSHIDHRNLRTRKSVLALVLQIFFGKEDLVKNWLIFTPDKVIFTSCFWCLHTEPRITSQNRVEIS
jgi:hypothetical protein